MTAARILLGAALLAAAAARPAWAGPVLEGVLWQTARVERGRKAVWSEAKELHDGPPTLETRVRARLTLKNEAAKPVEGILLRYSMTAKVGPAGGATNWGIPFSVDSRRVPKLGPGRALEVPLELGQALVDYTRRLGRAGWWMDQLKIQVMIEPRAGEASVQTAEAVLEVRR